MNPISEENLHVSVKKFTRIMVGIAIGFVALYLFIFFQLKQTESQLTSYGNVTDSAIGNFLENLPESDSVKVEKTVNGITFIVKGGEGSSLNADLFDSKNSDYFLNATNITEGTLKDSVYSAWKDLEAEGVVSNGKIKPEFIPTTSGGTSTATNIDWNNIQNRPAGLDNGDDTGTLSEAQVEEYVTNAAINLASGTTLNGNALATESWVNSQNYLSGVNFSQITNNNGGYLDYRPNNTACAQGETLKYDAGVNRWICGTDIGAGSMTWGGISGTLSDQTDLVSALGNKLNTTASFGGDTTGTYDAIVVTNDSHDHTSASISGLTAADFSSTNISQWTNDAGFITNDTSVAKNEITNTGTLPFVWEMSELATQVIVEGEDISLLNNNAGYITGVNHSQVANSAGVYWNYRPNNTACAQDEILKYDAGSSRWVCGTDASVGTISWGNITGSLADQIDLNNALNSKLDSTATFGGDVSGSYGNLQVAGESHDHTGATISGLSVADFTSGNVSQWTNDSGFITGLNHSQVSNSNGIYWDYRPNNTACAQDQVLKYDAGLNRWTCGTDAGSGSVTWGALTGTLSDQVDLNNALEGKLDESASFVGDVTGNYGATVVGNDSHDHTGSTISGLTPTDFTSANISQWTNDSGYITGVNFSEVSNGSGVYLNYKPNDVACDHGQTLKYDAGLTRWACGDDNGAGTIAWGDLTGNIADQGDLSTVLSSKLNLTANFGGDASGTYDNLQIANDSHAHTGASITGLGTANFTSDNISQWNNDAGFISGLDISQITNGAGKYFNYKPNDVACNDGGILEYDEGNARWICGVDNSSVGGGDVTVGSMTGSSLFMDSSADDDWLGLGTSAGKIEFDDQATDEILLMNANVGIGQATPTHTLDVNGNIGIAASGYLNFGATDGSSGYGFRDNAGVIEYKDSSGTWIPLNSLSGGGGGGGVVASVTTVQTRTQATYLAPNTGDGTEITPLTIVMTPKAAGNKVILEWYLNGESAQGASFIVTRNGTRLPDTTDVSNNRYANTATFPYDQDSNSTPDSFSVKIIDDNSLDVESTYRLFVRSSYATEPTFYLNRSIGSAGTDNFETSLSIGMATEIDPTPSGGGEVTVGSMTGSSLFMDSTADDDWLGLGVAAGRIEFDDQATDEILLMGANVGIGQSTPTHTLDVNGNIGLATSGYINFGATDGSSGYGIRDNGGNVEYKNSAGNWTPIPSSPAYIQLQHILPNGTDGGDAVANAWTQLPINTESSDDNNVCTLSANQFTLIAGTYEVDIESSFYNTRATSIRLRNVTDNTIQLIGRTTYVSTNGGESPRITGRFTISSTKTFEIQYIAETAQVTYGLGVDVQQRASNYGLVEVYRNIELRKVQ